MSDMQEVKPFREVPRAPEHCGKPMKRVQGQSVTGGIATVYVCECGSQQRGSV